VGFGLRTRTNSYFSHIYDPTRLFYKKKINIYIYLQFDGSTMNCRRSQTPLMLHSLLFDCCSTPMAAPRVRDSSRYVRARARGLQHAMHRQQLTALPPRQKSTDEPSCATRTYVRARDIARYARVHTDVDAQAVSRYARARARGHNACNAHTCVVR